MPGGAGRPLPFCPGGYGLPIPRRHIAVGAGGAEGGVERIIGVGKGRGLCGFGKDLDLDIAVGVGESVGRDDVALGVGVFVAFLFRVPYGLRKPSIP